MYRDTSEKWDLLYTNPEKWRQSYIFSKKKGGGGGGEGAGTNRILASAEKGSHSARTSILCHAIYIYIYRKLHPPHPTERQPW